MALKSGGRTGSRAVAVVVVLRHMAHAAVLLGAALLPMCAQSQDKGSEPPVTGVARIIDGDTIKLMGEVHRLHGIDAPERAQTCRNASGASWPCGKKATAALRAHIAGRKVTCFSQTRGRYGRWISVCYVGNRDLNAWMVRHGWALAYRTYSNDYVAQERIAKSNRRGVWSGKFTPQWTWRKMKKNKR